MIDTITYPQKDLMDYWEIGMTETFVNNKVKEHGFPKVIHKQFNKQTNEERVIEKRMLGYGKSDGKPKFNIWLMDTGRGGINSDQFSESISR